jgi:hypothetical protein
MRPGIVKFSKNVAVLGLSLGLIDFLLWLFLFEKYGRLFELAGVALILIFTVLSIACIVLLAWERLVRKEYKRTGSRSWNIALLLILLNIPMCLMLVFLWDWAGKRVLVTVENLSDTVVKSIQISGEDYQGKKIEILLNDLELAARENIVLDKWSNHNFDVTLHFPDTIVAGRLTYHRLFRGQPLLDTLRINQDRTTTQVRGEERIFKKKQEKQPITTAIR